MVQIMGVQVIDESFEEALGRLENILAKAKGSALYFVNAHTLNYAASRPGYREVLNEADLIYGDGTGVRWAARWRGVRLKANLNGTDLVPALLERARGVRCYLLGTTADAILRTVAGFKRKFPNCKLVGWHNGYLDATSSQSVVAAINAAGVDLLLVGMGNPLQEEWIARHRNVLNVKLAIAVGGLFAYIADDVDRAPAWLRRRGLEFLHIVRRQPVKLRRHLLGDPLFLLRMMLCLPRDLAAQHHGTRAAVPSLPVATAPS